jgi:hypothetical protein
MNAPLPERKRGTRVVYQDFTARVTTADTTAPASANSRADMPRTAASCFAMSWNADPATSANTSHVMAFCWVFVIRITPSPLLIDCPIQVASNAPAPGLTSIGVAARVTC